MGKLNKKLGIKQCKVLIESEGKCNFTDCTNCPGNSAYNKDICVNNGWRKQTSAYLACEQTVRSAKAWLVKNNALDNIYVEEE
jgi:hypothetical protein